MASKDTAAYWKERISTRKIKGENSSTLYARMSHEGRQCFINLNTANRQEGARTAATTWSKLKKDGWEAVKPSKTAGDTITIGDYLKLVEDSHALKSKTFKTYARKLRTLAAEIGGIKPHTHFDKKSAEQRRTKIDKIPCSILTSENVRKWKKKRLKGLEGEAESRALNTANSIIADARSLFGKKILPEVGIGFKTTPLSGLVVSNIESQKFEHQVDYDQLVQTAVNELEGDQLCVFVLAAGCGLRRSEIDRLRGEDIDLKAGTIRVTNTPDGKVKRKRSVRKINFRKDSLIADFLKGRETNFYVICPDQKFKRNMREDEYRCDTAMIPLINWLRSKGVKETKALHYLRKACGDVITRNEGIAVAANTLGNSYAMCHATYSDHSNTESAI